MRARGSRPPPGAPYRVPQHDHRMRRRRGELARLVSLAASPSSYLATKGSTAVGSHLSCHGERAPAAPAGPIVRSVGRYHSKARIGTSRAAGIIASCWQFCGACSARRTPAARFPIIIQEPQLLGDMRIECGQELHALGVIVIIFRRVATRSGRDRKRSRRRSTYRRQTVIRSWIVVIDGAVLDRTESLISLATGNRTISVTGAKSPRCRAMFIGIPGRSPLLIREVAAPVRRNSRRSSRTGLAGLARCRTS